VHARSLLTGKPYTTFEYGDSRFAEMLVQAILSNPPALIHMDSLDLHRWLSYFNSVPVACTHHSVESDLLKQRGERFRSRVLGAYVMHQARLIEEVERVATPHLALNVMMSDNDAERLKVLAPGARTYVAPNGVDTAYFAPSSGVSAVAGRVVFLGPTYMFPNQDGIEHFLQHSWEQVLAQVPYASLRLIGKNPPAHRERYQRYRNVSCLGYVTDIRPHMSEAACSIVPLRVGGGTRLKVLDAWAMGKAVVSTAVGCEGLSTVDGENILVRDDPKDFAEAVLEVLTNADLRQRLESNARTTAVQQYGWDRIGAGLRAVYGQLAAGTSV